MSSAALQPPAGAPAIGPARLRLQRRRSFWGRVLSDTMLRWGARLGAVWIGVMLICAVFAPFLASSHPLLMRRGGSWSSPLLRYLTFTDVTLLVAFFAAAVLLLMRGIAGGRRALAFVVLLFVAMPLNYFLVRPPIQAIYDQYRRDLATGVIERAVFAPIPYSPDDRLRDQPEVSLKEPGRGHPMGTTLLSADLASNMIWATRVALSIGFIATGIAVVIGVVVGGLMGYFAGWVDLLGMRLVEVFGAIPTMYLLLTFVAFFGRNLYVIMVIIGLTDWMGDAIFVRAEFLRLRDQDFVLAARATGLPLRSILFKHMLPNGVTPVLVSVSFGVAGAILLESTLSFLGIGLVGESSWGGLLNEALGSGGTFYWWLALFPGLAIFLTVFAYNLVGEALRDAIDPHLRKAAQL